MVTGSGARPLRGPAARSPPTSAAAPKFDQAIARFSAAYADQNELDYQRLTEAVDGGEVTAVTGV